MVFSFFSHSASRLAILLAVGALLAIGGSTAFRADRVEESGAPILPSSRMEAQDQTISVSLSVEGGESYDVEVLSGSSVYDVMFAARESHGLQFSEKEFSGLGTMIEAIGGVSGDAAAGSYWTYDVNGTPAQVGVSDYTVEAGDTIEWKYEGAR